MKFKIKSLTVGVLLLCIFSMCSAQSEVPTQTQAQSANGLTELQINSPGYNADKWYRDSAERNAIYREVFSMAENIIKLKVAQAQLKSQRWGVIMDIDETTLDNSAWDCQHDIKGNQQNWNDFAAEMKSVPTPGVKQFIIDIHQMGGYVNLVSNRPGFLEKATEKNLKSKGIYFDQVLLDATNTGTSFVDKNPRFAAIIEGKKPSKLPSQNIVAWFGDNIQDFPNLKQAAMINQDPNSSSFNAFGTMLFALPNPMYGSWEANQFK